MNSWTKAGTEPDVLCSSSAIGVILFANRHCRRQCSTPPVADPHASFASPDSLHTTGSLLTLEPVCGMPGSSGRTYSGVCDDATSALSRGAGPLGGVCGPVR